MLSLFVDVAGYRCRLLEMTPVEDRWWRRNTRYRCYICGEEACSIVLEINEEEPEVRLLCPNHVAMLSVYES